MTNEIDLNSFPPIVLAGSEGYWNAYDMGDELAKVFPLADASNFCYMLEYTGVPDGVMEIIKTQGIRTLDMLQEGEHDGEEWIWEVVLANGDKWHIEAGCDYTGWDCRSGSDWEKLS